MNVRDRIVELRRVPASSLAPNPRNWRTHPEAQRDALRGVLAEVGIADAVLARQREDGVLELIDGHLRAETLGAGDVPVLVLDVSEEEAWKILATHDPLAAMAEADPAVLDDLLREVETSNAALQKMLEGLTPQTGGEADATGPDPGEDRYQEQYGVIVVCEDEGHQERVYTELAAAGHQCRVVCT